jgi:hypothetical protein
MWLLDANVDVHLAPLVSQFGVASDTAANRGWKALENGNLVTAAVAVGFDCILTRDQAFANRLHELCCHIRNSLSSFCASLKDLGRSIDRLFSRLGRYRRSGRCPVSLFNGLEVRSSKA